LYIQANEARVRGDEDGKMVVETEEIVGMGDELPQS